MRRSRVGAIHFALLMVVLVLIARAGQLQLMEGERWSARADRQHVQSDSVPAPRGTIRDATGEILARSRELVRIHIAPREISDRAHLSEALANAGVDPRWRQRSLDRERAWVTLPSPLTLSAAARLLRLRGVYGEAMVERDHVVSPGVQRIIGKVASDGRGASGIELSLDSLLTGTPGLSSAVRDVHGRAISSPSAPDTPATPGHDVTLTINLELQEIADQALARAVEQMHADGGDIVVLDPHDGAILAMASRRGGRSVAATALTEPFEPGSTLKPFIAATLLSHGLAGIGDTIETYGGVYTVHGRTIRDVHRSSRLSLADVIRFSSNVGIARFAERLTWAEQYEALRDFGFGTPTLVAYPSEANGTLRDPADWSLQSQASLAMGYEIAVTPLQLATAYASIANGGELLHPMLIREIRSPEGDIVYRARRRVVRRVMGERVAATMRELLADVVESGTAMEADLATFLVGGKTGTARLTAVGQGYVPGRYTATFVGLFPAEHPQYVILTKLNDPAGVYGGVTAAPISRAVLQAALAARDAALDREALADRETENHVAAREVDGGSIDVYSMNAASEPALDDRPDSPTSPHSYLIRLPEAKAPSNATLPPANRPVPDVSGLPLRRAVRELHRAGFRVRLASGGAGDGSRIARSATQPAAGALAETGSLVRLRRTQ
ncbi:MAG: penicillin-binding transpeptidase domain-containing protein [Gemmatimonadaceae bacterium]